METIAVLILTHNEEKNIEKCLDSVRELTDRIFVIDSGSDDRTVELATGRGAQVQYRAWTNYAEQLNWSLDNIDFGTDWIMRLDADEELTPELVRALRQFLKNPSPDVGGIVVRRRVHFLGRWIRHGGYYPTWLLRVFRAGHGRCEQRWMDEHIVVDDGRTIVMKEDLIDKNNKDLTFWTEKHNKYATREMLDLLQLRQQAEDGSTRDASQMGQQAKVRRWWKEHVYARTPLFVRPFLYFVYRYFLRFGFLDGREGLIFHFLQGFWYRFLVDAKLYEYELKKRNDEHAAVR